MSTHYLKEATVDRYDYVTCPHCKQQLQLIDYSGAAHQLTCPSAARGAIAEGAAVLEPLDNGQVHRIGCICESCSATYERERWDPRG
jgi:uncharacterized protein YbaR (Trm112 family)